MVVFREAEVVVNARDNVTSALESISRFIDRLSGSAIDLKIGQGAFDSLDAMQEKVDSLGKTVAVDVALQTDTGAMDTALKGVDAGAQKAAAGVGGIADATKKTGNELDNTKKKSTGFFESMQAGSQKVGDALGGITEKFAALAITGAIGGFSWLGAKESAEYQKEVIATIGTRNGAKEGAMAEKFVGEAGTSGQEYTSSSRRTELLSYVEYNTKLRGEKAMAATRGIEKLAFSSETAEKKGWDAESLMRIGTRKDLKGVRPDMKGDINAIFGKDFTNKSLSARMKIIAEFDKKIDINEAMKEDPEKVFKLKLDKLSKGIGSTMIGPMNFIINMANSLVTVLDKIPLLKGIAGYGIMAVTAALGIELLVQAAASAGSGLMMMAKALSFTNLQATYLSVSTRASTAATWASTIAARASSAANALSAAVTRMLTVNTISNVAIENASFMSRIRMVAASIAYTASTIGATIATGGLTTAMSALAVVEGIVASPLLVPLALAAALIGLVAYKTGFLSSILKGISSINIGKVFKDISIGDFGKAWKDLTKGFKLPSLSEMWGNLMGGIKLPEFKLPDFKKMLSGIKIGDIFKIGLAVAFAPILLPLVAVVKLIEKLVGGTDFIGKILDIGAGLWKKMTHFLAWVADGVKVLVGMVNWLRDGLGITKREKEADLAKTGASIAKSQGKVDAKGKGIPYEWMTISGSGTGWFPKGTSESSGRSPNQGLSGAEIARLNKGKEAVDNAPRGFFEGIPGIDLLTSAVVGLTKAMSGEGIAGSIKDALSNLVLGIPGFDTIAPVLQSLKDTIDNLSLWLDTRIGEGLTNTATTALRTAMPGPALVYDTVTGALKIGGSDEPDNPPPDEPTPTPTPAVSTPAKPTVYVKTGSVPGDSYKDGDEIPVTQYESLGADQRAKFIPRPAPHAASGAEVGKSGLANVHLGEPIVPARLNKPGKLNEALGALQAGNYGAGKGRSTIVHVEGLKIEVSNPVLPDTSAVYHLTDILKRELDPWIENIIKRKIGQYIT